MMHFVTVTFNLDDWQLVPRTLTEEMGDVMECAISTEGQWAAALKVSPRHPDQPVE